MKKCMKCGGAMKKMQKGGPLANTSARAGIGTVAAGAGAMIGTAISDAIKKRKEKKALEAAKKATTNTQTADLNKKAKGGMPDKIMGPAKKPFAAGIPYFTGSGQTGPESMKKGGAKKAKFGASVPVQRSPKAGKVTGVDGGYAAVGKREPARTKFAKGGFPDLNKDGKVTKADILKGRGVIKKKGGSVKKK